MPNYSVRRAFAAGVLACFVTFLLTDPLKRSPIAHLPFEPMEHEAPPRMWPPFIDLTEKLTYAERRYEGQGFGPESLAWDPDGRGPYAGLSDGRVVRRNADDTAWETFAWASPSRTPELCDPKPVELEEGKSPIVYGLNMTIVPNLTLEHICGRPLGMRFHPVTGDLWFADAYFGLCKVGRQGGQAQVVVAAVEGRPLLFANDLDIAASDENGTIYFTDTSTRFQRRNFFVAIMEGWADGRLMRLDIATGKVEVIMRNLAFANGVALSKDKSFLIVCETTRARCMRYWIKGPKAGSSELFLDLPGLPDNIRLNPRGRFWIALHAKRGVIIDILTTRPWLRRIMMRLPLEVKILYGIIIGAPHGYLIEVDENGEITEVLEDSLGLVVRAISEVEERGGRLWMGSVIMPHVAVVDYPVKVKLPGKHGQQGEKGEAEEEGAVGEKEEEEEEEEEEGEGEGETKDEL
ncbi:hypothetical protein CLOM_g12254 [Closterium sp. NIES-68]|nr:hypothetical protein CLOM_g12254 [Closterium sp. NIES-68]